MTATGRRTGDGGSRTDGQAFTYEYDDLSASVAVVYAVSAVEGTDPTAADADERLFDVVNPNALDAVVDGRGAPAIEFRFRGFDVCVRDGVVRVRDGTER